MYDNAYNGDSTSYTDDCTILGMSHISKFLQSPSITVDTSEYLTRKKLKEQETIHICTHE